MRQGRSDLLDLFILRPQLHCQPLDLSGQQGHLLLVRLVRLDLQPVGLHLVLILLVLHLEPVDFVELSPQALMQPLDLLAQKGNLVLEVLNLIFII